MRKTPATQVAGIFILGIVRGDARYGAWHAGGMILTEYGLHFANESHHWRCVEWPDLVMVRGDCYQLIDATLTTGSFSLEGVGITYMLRRRRASLGPHQPRTRLM
jgi:hypothetical protein